MESTLKEKSVSENVVERFQKRMVDLAKEGSIGSLKTRHASLQSSYAHWMSLLDHPEVPILIYGERGTGKRRHVDEFLQVHNFSRKLQGLPEGVLKVFRADFVGTGFSELLQSPHVSEADVIYLENIHLLNLSAQEKVLNLLKRRRFFASQGLPLPRLVLGSEESLSVLVLKQLFRRDLFEAITGFAVFLPCLHERAEDIPQLIQVLSEEISGKLGTPPGWFVDFVARSQFSENLDELQKILREMLRREPNMALWNTTHLPANHQPRSSTHFVPASREEQIRFRSLLQRFQGDRKRAAKEVGMNYSDFLQKILEFGIR